MQDEFITLLYLVLDGPPRTKKNHGRVIKRGGRRYHVQSEAYQQWNASVQMQLARFRAAVEDGILPIKGEVNCRALFLRHAKVGDAVGFQQALADALQEGGIIENDRQIVSWDGTRLGKDSKPRIEVELERIV